MKRRRHRGPIRDFRSRLRRLSFAKAKYICPVCQKKRAFTPHTKKCRVCIDKERAARAAVWWREQRLRQREREKAARLKQREHEKAVAAKVRAAMAADLAAFDGFVRVLRRHYRRFLEHEHRAKV